MRSWFKVPALPVTRGRPSVCLSGPGKNEEVISHHASVRVAVAVMVMRAGHFERWRCATTVGCFAARCLELDGGVMNVETVTKRTVNAFENRSTLRHLHLGNCDVACKRMR